MENWTINLRTIFAVRLVLKRSLFYRCKDVFTEFWYSRRNRILSHIVILKWVDDLSIHGSAVHMFVGPAHSVRTQKILNE
jgi:hypothetical protein